MIDFNEFEFGTQCPTIQGESIALGNIDVKSLRKCTKDSGKYIIYILGSDKWNLCRIWDQSNSKLMERALNYGMRHNLEISICTIDKCRKLRQTRLFTTENTITGIELNGSRLVGNYFAILIADKLFI